MHFQDTHRTGRTDGLPGFTADDVASLGVVLSTLENETARLDAESHAGHVWSSWAALLRPTVDEMPGATVLRVPASFARELLDDLRKPFDDDERDSITDPEQIEYDAEIDAAVRGWVTQLDGEGSRILILASSGPAREWLDDFLGGAMVDGLTSRLDDGSTSERKAVVAALDGWTDVMRQLPSGAVA
jgi:hypothetical protein